MRYVAAYLLAALGGNNNITTDDIKTILESVGVGYDEERAEIVVNQCQGKSIAELIEQVQRRWLPCLQVAVVAVELLLLRQGVTPLHRMQLKRRRKRRRRNQNLDR